MNDEPTALAVSFVIDGALEAVRNEAADVGEVATWADHLDEDEERAAFAWVADHLTALYAAMRRWPEHPADRAALTAAHNSGSAKDRIDKAVDALAAAGVPMMERERLARVVLDAAWHADSEEVRR